MTADAPGLDLQIQHALGGEGQYLAHQIAFSSLLDQLNQGPSVVGPRLLLQVRVRIRTLPVISTGAIRFREFVLRRPGDTTRDNRGQVNFHLINKFCATQTLPLARASVILRASSICQEPGRGCRCQAFFRRMIRMVQIHFRLSTGQYRSERYFEEQNYATCT